MLILKISFNKKPPQKRRWQRGEILT